MSRRSASWPRLDAREAARLLGGTVGTELHRLAQGIDDRPVAPRAAAKQVSAETTFDVDLTAMSAVHDAVARLAESAHRRLLASGRAARTVTVKVRSADFTTATRSETAAEASTDLAVLTATRPAPGPRGRARRRRPAARRVARRARRRAAARAVHHRARTRRRSPATAAARPVEPAELPRPWRTGDDVHHPEHGHGWVQGAGHGRVTVRFETRSSGPGRALTFAADDPALRRADPLACLA